MNPLIAAKLALFMDDFVLPLVDPSHVTWLFSLSGGVDSGIARAAVEHWYEERGLTIREHAFHVDQWAAPIARIYRTDAPGHVSVLDARTESQERIAYRSGQPGPCHACSMVRRDLTDHFVSRIQRTSDDSAHIIVVRGHHLTDLAVSLLWRALRGHGTADFVSSGKGHPFRPLGNRVYLAKPLVYAVKGDVLSPDAAGGSVDRCACNACPAHAFPGRRDIVAETAGAVLASRSAAWELEVPGLVDLIDRWSRNAGRSRFLRENYTVGPVNHTQHLPAGAVEHVADFYLAQLDREALTRCAETFTVEPTLDETGFDFLAGGGLRTHIDADLVPAPRLLLPALTGVPFASTTDERLMMLCGGPFWGACGLPRAARQRALAVQARLYPSLTFDDEWSHTATFLRWYYGKSTTAMPAGHSR